MDLELIGATVTSARFAPDSYVVSVAGELDLSTTGDLERAFRPILDGSANPTLIADLSRVCFLDSTALALLGATAKELRQRGSDLMLVSNGPRVLRTLQISGLDKHFSVRRQLTDVVGWQPVEAPPLQ